MSWCHEKSAPVVYIGMASQFPLWNGVTVPVRLHASHFLEKAALALDIGMASQFQLDYMHLTVVPENWLDKARRHHDCCIVFYHCA